MPKDCGALPLTPLKGPGPFRIPLSKSLLFALTLVFVYIVPAFSAELITVKTRSVGPLSLPAGWSVVFKDEEAEKNLVSPDLTLNVQQVLCAKTDNASGGQGAALQVFSIWGSGKDGSEQSLPDGMLAQDKFVTGLIGGRYGNVSELGEETVETALKNVTVATYGVTFSLEEGPELRYKCAFLYRGGKQVLVLLNYGSEFEDHWHEELASLLNTWVGSLTFTPAPAPLTAPALEASLPALPALSLPAVPTKPSETTPAEITPPIQQRPRASSARGTGKFSFSLDRIPIGQLSLLWGTFFFILYVLRKRNAKKRPQTENDGHPVPLAGEVPEMNAKTHVTGRALPTLEEWLAEESLIERDAYVPPAADDGGFDKVYNLFGQVLKNIAGEEESPAGGTSTPEEQR